MNVIGRAESAIRILNSLLQAKESVGATDLNSLRMTVSTLQLLAKVLMHNVTHYLIQYTIMKRFNKCTHREMCWSHCSQLIARSEK